MAQNVNIDPEVLAQEAYTAYGSVTDWKNYQGLAMPTWGSLPPKIQEAWRAAVTRVATLVREEPTLSGRKATEEHYGPGGPGGP